MNRVKLDVFVLALAAMVLGLTLLNGCSTQLPIISEPGITEMKVSFTDGFNVDQNDDFDRDDPESMVRFAVWLFHNGKAKDAGDLFSDLSEIKSRDGDWEIQCLTAAGLAYLEAGQLEALAEIEEKISAKQDRWAALQTSVETKVVVGVGSLVGERIKPGNLQFLFDDIVSGKGN